MLGRLVAVTWRDAHGAPRTELEPSEIATMKSYVFTTYGVMVRDDRNTEGADRVCAIAHEKADDGRWRGVTFVPVEMITGVVDLGAPTRRASRPRASSQRQNPPENSLSLPQSN
jgi:hypothetical protein